MSLAVRLAGWRAVGPFVAHVGVSVIVAISAVV